MHHTQGCYNYSGWKAGTPGPVLPANQPKVGAKMTLETCAAACYARSSAAAELAGVSGGDECFCGTSADLSSAAAKALSRPKTECATSACAGDPHEKECGGAGRLLVYAYSCDRAQDPEEAEPLAESRAQHNPSVSFGMRIDVV